MELDVSDGRPVENPDDGVGNPLLPEVGKVGPPGVKGLSVLFELDDGDPVEKPDEGVVIDPLPVR